MIRASKAPLALACPASTRSLPFDLSPNIETVRAGQASHVCAEAAVLGLEPDIEAIAKQHGVDVSELGYLYHNTKKIWSAVSAHFPAPEAEVALSPDFAVLTGTADVISHNGKTAAVLDWKSNYVERDYDAQLKAYAWLLRESRGMPESGEIVAVTAWIRSGDYSVARFTGADLDAFYADIGAAYGKQESFTPGAHCGFCPHRISCDVHSRWTSSTVSALATTPPTALSTQELVALYNKVQRIQSAINDYRDLVKLALKQHGPQKLDDGRTLRIVEQSREEVDARAAWPVLVGNGFTGENIAECTKMSKTAIGEVAASRAGKGEKGKAKQQIMNQLRDAGALTQTTFEKIEITKE